MRSFVLAGCIGATMAIKQVADEQVAAAPAPEPEAAVVVEAAATPDFRDSEAYKNFHTRIESKDWAVENIAEVNTAIENWFANTARPAMHGFADLVEQAAWHTEQAEHGELLDTCAEGTACRDEVEKRITTQVNDKWDKLMDSFKLDVTTTINQTEVIVGEGWDAFEKCERDHPCCDTDEVVWANIQKNIERIKKLINDKWTEYDNVQEEIDRIEEECPDVDFTQYRAGWTEMARPDLDELAQEDNAAVGESNGPPALN